MGERQCEGDKKVELNEGGGVKPTKDDQRAHADSSESPTAGTRPTHWRTSPGITAWALHQVSDMVWRSRPAPQDVQSCTLCWLLGSEIYGS